MRKVREGYKMSELGEVPKEWEVTSIGEYIEQKSIKNKDLQVVNVVSVTKYRGIVDSLEYFDKQVFSKDISTYKIIEKDEFAYSTIHLNEGALGYLQHCNKAVLSPMYTVFKIDSNLINKYFLYNTLKSKKYIDIYERIGEGSVDRRSSIPFNKFKDMKIALPPIKEQEKIALILLTVDEQIDNVDGLIEKNKELKKGLMQQLLTKGIGHTKFKKTEIGEIPEEWEVKKLKDLGSSIIGLTYSPDDLVGEGEGTLVLRSSNIKNSRIVFDDNKYVKTNIQDKLIVKEDDILICSRNGSKDLIGKCALIDKKTEGCSFGAFMTIYRSNYNKYLFNVFTSYMFKRQIYNNLGATINQITTDNLNNFKVILPPIKEQEKIASILLKVDEKIDEYANKKQKLEELKRGLMQQLLTGAIRVL